MIDLNEVASVARETVRHDLDAIVAGLRSAAAAWVPRLYPNGRRVGDQWRLANIRGDAPRRNGSCVIELRGPNAGDWHDFETGDGGGPINAVEYASGLTGAALFEHAASIAGHLPTTPRTPAAPGRKNAAQEIEFILRHAAPIAGTRAETYLRQRGLEVLDDADLRFHPSLTHWDTRAGYPALIGIIRDRAGAIIGVHRTYLDPEEPAKAKIDKPKMMLGQASGGAVRLGEAVASLPLILCEGIETGLALRHLTPRRPVWATLSTKGLERVQIPDDVAEVVVFADHDESGAGMRAAQRAAQRLKAEGRRVTVAAPPDAGADANDLLVQGGAAAIEAALERGTAKVEDEVSAPAEAANEDAIAAAFSRRYADRLRYDHHRGRWYFWEKTRWRVEETGLALHLAREECRRTAEALPLDEKEVTKLLRAGTTAAVIRFAQIDRRHAVTSEIWDPDHFALGTPGGTVDLRTGRLRAAQRGDHITQLTAVAPAASAECPTWLSFLEDATQADDGLVRFLQQIAGYCLTGDTREHALFFIYGPGGNGKSVFLNTLNGILADYAETAVMDAFAASAHDKHSTDIAMLRGARLVSVSETEEGRAWAETRVKQLTGGDKVTARFMRQDNFTFTPRFKLVIVGNHKPVLTNVDDAAKRRFNIIPFTRKPPRPDRELEEKLKAEWPGILRWMIEGCLDWQANGLVRPAIVAEATAEYFDDQDTLGQWLEEHCIREKREFEVQAKLYQSWKGFADRQGDRPGSSKGFSANLIRRGFKADRIRIGGTQYRIFRGLSLRYDPAAAGIDHG
jgi:P4 family phage/plasmid primase-like protien